MSIRGYRYLSVYVYNVFGRCLIRLQFQENDAFLSKAVQIIGADETLTIAKHVMPLLLAFTPESIIYDSQYGLGLFTDSILAPLPPGTTKRHATNFS